MKRNFTYELGGMRVICNGSRTKQEVYNILKRGPQHSHPDEMDYPLQALATRAALKLQAKDVKFISVSSSTS